jgi:magnesium chelatase subunit I
VTGPRTVGELRSSGHELRGVKDEIRANLLAALREGRDPWPGIVGFESTVLPQLERALIAGHDVVLLGERGQGKTRLLRSLVGLLDEWSPVIAGSELGEHPYDPITPASRRRAPRPATTCRRLAATATSATPRSSPPPTPRWPT